MARQKLGPKKVRKIEAILGKPVEHALVRGNSTHFHAHVLCKDGSRYTVNYKTGEVFEYDDNPLSTLRHVGPTTDLGDIVRFMKGEPNG